MSDDSTGTSVPAVELAHAGRSVANPRRLRIDRDGRPLPVGASPAGGRDDSPRST